MHSLSMLSGLGEIFKSFLVVKGHFHKARDHLSGRIKKFPNLMKLEVMRTKVNWNYIVQRKQNLRKSLQSADIRP